MAENKKPDQEGAFTPEGLEAFQERFGDLSERMERAAHPYLERTPLPSAEHPKQIEARENAEAANEHDAREAFLPDLDVAPEFNAAVENIAPERDIIGQGKGSLMVQGDSAQNTLDPPPALAKDQDRETHSERMAEDDAYARSGEVEMSEAYYAELESRMEDHALEQDALGEDQSQDRDFDQDHTP